MTITHNSDSALLKVKRASEHIDQLDRLLSEQHPFSVILETDTHTGQRSIKTKKDEALTGAAALVAGDAIHNLRSALDHAYWAIVGPFATNSRGERAVQFPFSETAAGLERAVKNRLAHHVGQQFFDALMDLKPYGEAGGNRLLYLVHALDVPDKHRLLLPVANFKTLDAVRMRRIVPDFPASIGGLIGLGECGGSDMVWYSKRVDAKTLGAVRPPTLSIFEKKLDVPVEILFSVAELDFRGPMIPTLHQFVNVTKESIRIIRDAAQAP